MAGIRPSRVLAFAAYEVRRALARRKVLAVVAFTALLDTVPYFVLSTSGTKIIPARLFPYLWVAGLLAPFALFIQFIAILIAAGAMSEEYEQGTVELILSKPVSRSEFFVGKFVGGYLLLFFIIVVNATLSIVSATVTYGQQLALGIIPGTILVEAYASLLFFSVAFMLGELLRRSSLAYIMSAAFLVSSEIIGVYLSLAYDLTGKAIYQTVHAYLPTIVAGSLPSLYAEPLLPSGTSIILGLIAGSGSGTLSLGQGSLLVATYFVAAFSVAIVYFLSADVSRRVS